MPTFYERLQLYKQRPDALQISNKKIRKLRYALAKIHNRNCSIASQNFIESIEGDKTFRVKDYPQSFVPTIDGLINRLHDTILAAQPKPIVEKRLRKRIPAKKKPVFSTSKQ